MATAKTTTGRPRPLWLKVLLVLLLGAGIVLWFYRTPIAGYGETGAAVGARIACSCRYVAGRSLQDCKKDFESGMGAVFLSEDEDEKSVTGHVPLVASETARYRKGYGCVLDSWDE
jgi:hypothetical protein